MSLCIDTYELIAGALVIGNTGLGVLGQNIPSTGTHGPGYIYNDLSLPADNGKEYMGRIVTPPALGVFFAFEDSSFTFTGAPDGVHTFTYKLFQDGVDLGNQTGTITVGASSALSGGATLGDVAASGGLSSVGPSNLSGGATLGDVSAAGSLGGSTLPTKARPASDISAGGWSPSSGVSLSDMVNEEVANPATFISTTTANSPCEMALNATVYPGTASQTVSYDAFSLSGSTLTVNLRHLGAVVASWTQALTPVNTRYTQTLTPQQIALLGPTGVSIELIAS